jgi:hypothetical protein
MFIVNPSKLKKQTWALIFAIIGGSIIAQTDFVQRYVAPLAAAHPHLKFLVPTILGILAIIHNPLAVDVIKDVYAQTTEQQEDGSKKTTTVEVKTEQTSTPQ